MFRISIFFIATKHLRQYEKKKDRIEISLLLGEMKLHKTLNKIWRKKETLKQY